jgi:hypothetical protein
MGNPQSKSTKTGHPEHWDPVDSKSRPSSAPNRKNKKYYKTTDPTLIRGIQNEVRWIDWAYVPKEKTPVTPPTLVLERRREEEVGRQDVRFLSPADGRREGRGEEGGEYG